ncbi:MAG: hypothetical protein E7I81_02450 [Streptococcus mitis]|nr:hypothetical protein [Streptococcus mitis]
MKKEKMIAFSFSLFLGIITWFTLATSVRKGLPLLDASIFEYFGYAMSHGQRMYLELFDHKGPVIFLINYLGYSIGASLGIKILYIASLMIFFYIGYYISRLFTGIRNSFVVLVITFIIFESFFEGGWGLEGYILPCLTYSLYIFLKYFLEDKINKYEIILSGFSFAVVLFTKANMIGIWLIFSLLVTIKLIYQKQFSIFLKYIALFITGSALFIVPLCCFLWFQGSLKEMFYQSVVMNFIYSKESGYLTVMEMIKWYMNQVNVLQLNLMIVIAMIAVWKQYGIKILFYNGAFIFCLMLALISKRAYLHYLIVLIPLFIPYISVAIKKFMNKSSLLYFLIFTIGLVFIYWGPIHGIKDRVTNRSIDYSVKEKEVADYIHQHTNEQDRIYSHRLNGIIYLYSERLSSTKFFFVPSLKDETPIIDSFKESFKMNPPKYIVFDSKWDYGRLTDSFIKELIQKNYHEEKQIDTMKIYQIN